MHDEYGTPYYVTIARLCGATAEPAFLKAWQTLSCATFHLDCPYEVPLTRFPHTTRSQSKGGVAFSCQSPANGPRPCTAYLATGHVSFVVLMTSFSSAIVLEYSQSDGALHRSTGVS
jgi:hypothetical protein